MIVCSFHHFHNLSFRRVRALRFDSNASEWKERGIGILKILRQKENSSKFRILMRREKILKICLNHAILSEMSLSKNIGSSKTWIYFTPADVSDGEAKPENLGIMFKTDEAAEEFKNKFDEVIEIIKKSKSTEQTEETKEETKEEKTEE